MKIRVFPHLLSSKTCKKRVRDETAGKCKPGKCMRCDLIRGLYEAQEAVALAMNSTVRRAERADGQIFDEFLQQHRHPPRTKDKLQFSKHEHYQLARENTPHVASGIISAATSTATKKWAQVRWKALAKQEARPPFYRSENTPVPVRAQDFAVRKTEQKDRFALFLSLHSREARVYGGTGREFQIPLVAKDARQRTVLSEIAEGKTCKVGEAQLQRDRRHRWYVRIAYTRLVPVLPQQDAAAINRGIVRFLMTVTDRESDGRLPHEGHDIEEHLRRTQAHRRQLQHDWRMSQRKGRGRKRALRPTDVLMGKSARWRDTKNQVIAREAIKWCLSKGKTVLFIEDFKGIRDGRQELLEGGYSVWRRVQEWRFFDLQTRLINCADEVGMHVYIVPCQNISKTCPACGAVDLERKPARLFKCPACGYKRYSDEAAARVLLQRGLALRAKGELVPKTKTPK